MLEHDLVAALAVDLVGHDVQVEELDLLVGELVLLAQRGRLLAVDRRHLRLEPDHQARYGDDRVLAHGRRRSTSSAGRAWWRHVVGMVTRVARRAAGLGEADQEIGMPVAADLLLVHVVQQEVLRVLVLVRHARVDVA
jgi:hypothetical protein